MPAKHRDWTREEHILALNLYCKIPFERHSSPVVERKLQLDAGWAADQVGAPGTAQFTMDMLLKKNGYVLEQLYSPLIVHATPEDADGPTGPAQTRGIP